MQAFASIFCLTETYKLLRVMLITVVGLKALMGEAYRG